MQGKSHNTHFYYWLSIIAITLIAFSACEKEVDIKLNDASSGKLVIEGGIENNTPPFVILTRSIGYFGSFDLNTLQSSYVHNAKVTVNDGTTIYTLREYEIDTSGNNKFYFYSIDTSQSSFLLGRFETTYTLTVEVDGAVYTGTTKIPTPTSLDSVISFYPESREGIADIGPDARLLKIYFKDPDTPGNFVRYYTALNGGPFFPAQSSVFSDEIINGVTFNAEFPLGEPYYSTKSFDSLGIAFVGDTIQLRWSAIDKQVYDFWSQYEYSLVTLGNPFASPIRVKSNMNNGALGVWAGYGSIYTTVILK